MEFWRCKDDSIYHVKEMVKCFDLVLCRRLKENLFPQVDHLGVGIDSISEFGYRSSEGVAGFVTLPTTMDMVLYEAMVNSTTGGKPATVAGKSGLGRLLRHFQSMIGLQCGCEL